MKKYIVILMCVLLFSGVDIVVAANKVATDYDMGSRISAIERIRHNIQKRREMRKDRIGVLERIKLNRELRKQKRQERKEGRQERRSNRWGR